MSENATLHSPLRRYLTLAPMGLGVIAMDSIRSSLKLKNYECRDLGMIDPTFPPPDDDIRAWSDSIRARQHKKIAKKKARLDRPVADDNGAAAEDMEGGANEPRMAVGSTHLADQSEVLLGHHNGSVVVSRPGLIEGTVPIRFDTDAPANVVASIRGMGCGPLLALVVSSSCCFGQDEIQDERSSSSTTRRAAKLRDATGEILTATDDNGEVLRYNQTLNEAVSSITAFLQNPRIQYLSRFREALNLWREHAETVWFAEDDPCGLGLGEADLRQRRDALARKTAGTESFMYRVSCIRSYSKKYRYKREDVIPEIAEAIVPVQELSRRQSNAGAVGIDDEGGAETVSDGKTAWVVDLKRYDLEILAILLSNRVAIAIPLRPYQHIGSKSYSSGKVPPDVTPPYLRVNSGIVRLRPTTAVLLLRLAGIRPGEVVLDPCAGVGTVPVEAMLSGCLGLGGDVALDSLSSIDVTGEAVAYMSEACKYQAQHGLTSSSYPGAVECVAWDASILPLRDGCCDCVVSDLPFGQKCLSASKLSALLPRLFGECARVLRPGGRAVLLCGAFQGVMDALVRVNAQASPSSEPGESEETEHEGVVYCVQDASFIPCNIGGLMAWVIIVRRGSMAVRKSNDGLDGIRREVARRKRSAKDRIEKRRRKGENDRINEEKQRIHMSQS